VTRSLLKTLRLLSTPTDSAFRPNDLVTALASNLVNQRQQDAQELYQLLISALDNETQKQKSKQEGLEGALHLEQDNELIENPLNGLLASYTTCKKCKYSVKYYIYFIIVLLS
jgi:ubiquitin C-terminal hydrolase